MDFQIETYMQTLLRELQNAFGSQLLYLGLQGSYSRGEATENSDIDAVVLLEELAPGQMDRYRKVLQTVGSSEKSCGFISGRKEFANWNRFEICLLLHETKNYYGRLVDFAPTYTTQDIKDYLKINLGNLYHELCYRYIHADRQQAEQSLRFCGKMSFYLLQALGILRQNKYAPVAKELENLLEPEDLQALALSQSLKNPDYAVDFEKDFRLLFDWCSRLLQTL